MWNRSVEKNSLRYVDFVGNGDCSSHRDVVKAKPYGDEVIVRKVECVGHIQKRMGGRLRRKKKDMKGKKLSDGKTIGGRHRLTDNLIDIFQRYYRKALRQNKGNLPNMQKAVKAIWHHYASTAENQMHEYCPEGNDSWCKWLKDQTNGTSSFKPKNVAPAVMQEILPTFEALWDENLLQSVLEGLSQNNNEALNHLVWDNVLKKNLLVLRQSRQLALLLFACLMVVQKPYKVCSKGSIWKLESTAGLVSPPLTSKDHMLQDRRLWIQQRFAARFSIASERVEMNKMKSERAQPMSLEHLNSEFLF